MLNNLTTNEWQRNQLLLDNYQRYRIDGVSVSCQVLDTRFDKIIYQADSTSNGVSVASRTWNTKFTVTNDLWSPDEMPLTQSDDHMALIPQHKIIRKGRGQRVWKFRIKYPLNCTSFAFGQGPFASGSPAARS